MNIWKLIRNTILYPFAVIGDVMDLILLVGVSVVSIPFALFYALYKSIITEACSKEAAIAQLENDLHVDGDLERNKKRIKEHFFCRVRNLSR